MVPARSNRFSAHSRFGRIFCQSILFDFATLREISFSLCSGFCGRCPPCTKVRNQAARHKLTTAAILRAKSDIVDCQTGVDPAACRISNCFLKERIVPLAEHEPSSSTYDNGVLFHQMADYAGRSVNDDFARASHPTSVRACSRSVSTNFCQ